MSPISLLPRPLAMPLAVGFLLGMAPGVSAQDCSAVAGDGWSFNASVGFYVVPNGGDFLQPVVTADRNWLHLEARYNYEALQTASLWLGRDFAGGGSLEWAITPMLGVVFGATNGAAAGFEGTLHYWKLDLYSASEYLADTGDVSSSFIYNWSELSMAPGHWWRLGLVLQRTQLYQTGRSVERGVLLGATFKSLTATAYLFNPDDNEPAFVLSAGVTF